ncbi:hypothetical protein X975_01777, partial [Stegodyphus mimosarum]
MTLWNTLHHYWLASLSYLKNLWLRGQLSYLSTGYLNSGLQTLHNSYLFIGCITTSHCYLCSSLRCYSSSTCSNLKLLHH